MRRKLKNGEKGYLNRIGDVESGVRAVSHQFPACFFLCLVCCLQLVVLGDVSMQRAHHDHCHHSRQEEHNHERIDDGEPMDLIVQHQQIGVPSGCPPDVTCLHADIREHSQLSAWMRLLSAI